MPITFEYKINEQRSVMLEATEDHIEEAAAQLFREYATKPTFEIDFGSAIECVAGSFWKEAEANALDCLVGQGDFWNYVKTSTSFFDSDSVRNLAIEKAVKEYEGRLENNKAERL